MPIYIAMLRGINVSGQKLIKMDALRDSMAALGFRQVKTYVQSGNIIFEAGKNSPVSAAEKIGKQILKDYGFSLPVIMRTAEEMERVARENPLLKEAGIDESKLHVTFLSSAAPGTAAQVLSPLATKPERLRVCGREIYLYCPNGYGDTKVSNNALEKKLGVRATTRNWKTVNALLALAQT